MGNTFRAIPMAESLGTTEMVDMRTGRHKGDTTYLSNPNGRRPSIYLLNQDHVDILTSILNDMRLDTTVWSLVEIDIFDEAVSILNGFGTLNFAGEYEQR